MEERWKLLRTMWSSMICYAAMKAQTKAVTFSMFKPGVTIIFMTMILVANILLIVSQ
ncbi:hypothetical protein HYC85_003636 [Camellia sinensis]|uniref:Uncharacterized protein n=1 Tax=Camellia sinensis TaxID=4442 RepID=A0A7J7HVZ4_CAMSI|nr:hypothetical protein HYC85_003636 [Camellia sinensis]